jgi:tetratricopeptide (TPR) repeat protein
MNVLFCNIAWMKYYEGVSEDDKPKNGGSYIKENVDGGECFNFLDYNGKCYGFVMTNGDMALELHFKEAKKHQEFFKDVLVIWVATNDNNETRIVGWYENATVYRQEQFVEAFTNENFNLYYRIEALRDDCYLLPEEQRTFPIQRAAQTGKGTGMGRSNVWYAESSFAQTVLIPKIIEYIDNYNGELANTVYTDDVLNAVIEESDNMDDYKKLYDEGIKCYEDDYYVGALKFFNTARIIKETPEVLLFIANCLFLLNCFDKAIALFEKVIELEDDNIQATENLIIAFDFKGNREETIKYCNRILEQLDDSEEGINDKIYYTCVMFDIYISLRDEKNARAIIDKIQIYSNDEEAKMRVKEMKTIIKEVFEE